MRSSRNNHGDQETGEGSETTEGQPEPAQETVKPNEIGGPGGPEPTRFGDWERAGRCIDF